MSFLRPGAVPNHMRQEIKVNTFSLLRETINWEKSLRAIQETTRLTDPNHTVIKA
jgi:hypothetical protein